MVAMNVICLVGDSEASGSSKINKLLPENLLSTKLKKDSDLSNGTEFPSRDLLFGTAI
ncbi:MAG: hypothetical protein Sw1PiTSA_07010 [Shewanella algae]|nr:hypothetical protein TUM3811_06860 [Shewanella algae]BCV64005.1 hypothetical protein TUM17386_36760 [Shewanella algae]